LQAFEEFEAEQGESPDMVVMSTILWDLARLSDHTMYLTEYHILPPSVLESWMGDVSNMLAFIEVCQDLCQIGMDPVLGLA
jgi:hypothetical protein